MWNKKQSRGTPNGQRPNYITRAGYERIRARHEKLLVEDRPQQLLMLKGNIHDNFVVEQAKRDLLVLEAQIKSLESFLRNPIFIDDLEVADGKVSVGTRVTIREQGRENTESYALVGEGESDLAMGYISWQSPLAQALLGKRPGEIACYQLPNGDEIRCEVLKIEAVFGRNRSQE